MNPKCTNCHCYFIPETKSSGLLYKTCKKCQTRVKNKYALKSNKDYTLEIYNEMTLSTKKIEQPKQPRSGKREIPVEVQVKEEDIVVEKPQDDIPISELINEPDFLSEAIGKKKRIRKPKIVKEESKDEIPVAEPEELPVEPKPLEELVLPPAPESAPELKQEEPVLLYNEDKTKVFNPATKRWCKVDSKAGKKVAVV